jgi:hypothetical protein
LTDEAYRYAATLPVAEQLRVVSIASSVAFTTAADYGNRDSDPIDLSPEDLAEIAEGIADSDAGRHRDGDVAVHEMRARMGWSHD